MNNYPSTAIDPEIKGTHEVPGEHASSKSKLERSIYAVLETYSNVHRGSGHYSLVSTHLYEQAREIVKEFLNLRDKWHIVVFCSSMRASELVSHMKEGSFTLIRDQDWGLSLGVHALVAKKSAFPRGIPFQSGGGTARLIAPGWVIWAKPPDKFEAGTPAIVNVIAFACALKMGLKQGNDIFGAAEDTELTSDEMLYRDDFQGLSGYELLERLRQTMIGYQLPVPVYSGTAPFINLDNSASTPALLPVWNVFRQTLHQPLGIRENIIREVKTICADFLQAPAGEYDLLFTSGTTEGINLVARNLKNTAPGGIEPVVMSSLLEHSSNDLPWWNISRQPLLRVPVNKEGFFELSEMERLLRDYNEEKKHGQQRITIIAITGASNVLGTYNDLAEIGRMARRYGALLFVDAAQMAAHHPIRMKDCHIDFLAFSAHKVYAPFGCGVLAIRKNLLKLPDELQNSVDNAAGIAALGKSLVLIQRIGWDAIRAAERSLTTKAIQGLAKIQGITVYGYSNPSEPDVTRRGGVVIFNCKGKSAHSVARALAEEAGIGVRSGCHCAHITVKHILNIPRWAQQIQRLIVGLFPKVELPGVVRVSFGIGNTEQDVDWLLHTLNDITSKKKERDQVTRIKARIQQFIEAAENSVFRDS